MAVKKSNIISIALLLGLAMPQALASNDLTQLDLKRASNNAVDVTLFTSNQYNDNVLVRKKSDNKYVILIPKVQSSGFNRSSLNGVKDLVSDIDVKTVNDTTGGYTKVTLITTKPLDIKTKTQKSAPLSEEQKEYNTLIAQANAVKNNIAQPKPQQTTQKKTEVTVNKQTTANKDSVKKAETNKPNIQLTEVNPENYEKQVRKARLQELINEVKEDKLKEIVPEQTPEISDEVSQPAVMQDAKDIPKEPTVQKTSLPKRILRKVKHNLPAGFALIAAFLILSRIVKSKKEYTNVYPENIDAQTPVSNAEINSELSWQEKYKLYIDKSAEPVARANNKGNYSFIKTPAKINNEIEEKRAALEQMVSDLNHNPEIEPEIVETQSEDDVIHKNIKFKAFDNRSMSLKMTSRNKSRFKKYEVEIPLHEQKNIDLGESALHTNPRSLKDANLKVSDVAKNRIKYEPKDYVMSSVDEYFSIVDREQAVSNPITKKDSSFQKGLIVKSGYNIDKNKGIYLVNKNGQNALVGKVNDEVFVLKKFDGNISNPIQVRHDNENVYMVKAGGFKSLVEVNDEKMGVLIEL